MRGLKLIKTKKFSFTQTFLQYISTHQAASIDTHSTRLRVASCAIKYTPKVVVEVVTQG